MTTNQHISDEAGARIDQIFIETKPLYLCCVCGVETRELDKFCRRCGARQDRSGKTSPAVNVCDMMRGVNRGGFPLSHAASLSANGVSGHLVSGPLLLAIAIEIVSSASAQLNGSWAKRIIPTLISVPIWLMIILLSPLDAYAIARAVTSLQHKN